VKKESVRDLIKRAARTRREVREQAKLERAEATRARTRALLDNLGNYIEQRQAEEKASR